MVEPNKQVVLETKGLSREFSGFFAVKNVDLQVRQGDIHAVIGPNGAGKTTCFNLLTRFLKATAGAILFEGREITRLPPSAVARLGLVRSFQVSAVFPKLSCLENVRLALQRSRGESFDFWRPTRILNPLNERASELLADVGLEGREDEVAELLPYGLKRALELATTLALNPRMLLLDEPTAGMTGADVERVVKLINKIRQGRTILLVEHNLRVVEGLCDRITVMTRGQIIAEGDYATVSANPMVIDAYLGVRDA